MSVYNRRPERTIADFKRIEDMRKPRPNGFTENRQDMYNAMLNLILKHKVELQKIPAASSLASATNWAAKRGLRAGEADLDKDGKPETIVYDKSGKPYIINGYRLKASDYPIRKAFYTAFPTPEDRAGESMSSWIKQQAYSVQVDPDNPWRQSVTNTPFGDRLKEWGYRMPTRPKKKQSVFNIFCKLVAPVLKEYYEGEDELPQTLVNGPSCVKLLKKIISPIAMYRMLYMKMVEREYFFHKRRTEEEYQNWSYAQFKKHIKNYENQFYTWFKINYLTPDQLHFKPNKVTPRLIQGQIVKDGVQWDGSDKDDAIVFMIGLDNMSSTCGELLRNESRASAFLEALADKKSPEGKQATKDLAKWKKIASASQKKFFKDQIGYLFENEGAYERFVEALDNGLNPLAHTTEQAVQESVEQPASPMRQPTPQQEAQTAAERGESTVATVPAEPQVTEEQMRQLEQQNQEADNTPAPDVDVSFD